MLKYAIQEWLTSYPEVLAVPFVGFLMVGDPIFIDACVEMVGTDDNCGYPGP